MAGTISSLGKSSITSQRPAAPSTSAGKASGMSSAQTGYKTQDDFSSSNPQPSTRQDNPFVDALKYMGTKKYWGEVGQVLKGEVKGVAGVVKGTADAVMHPLETTKGIYRAATNPKETAKNVWENMSKPFKEGDMEGMGKVVGGTLATIAGPKVLKGTKSTMFGKRMTPAQIDKVKTGVHMTDAKNLDSIAQSGLRATKTDSVAGLYKNLTTGGKSSVYMFDKMPSKAQKIANFADKAGDATAPVKVDLTKLDPKKLYQRDIDGAITYRDPKGIPADALTIE